MASAEPDLGAAPEPTGRAGARVASYAAAVAARGTLSSRLGMSNALGETVTSYASVARRAELGRTSIA
jgi:hypothetical protein